MYLQMIQHMRQVRLPGHPDTAPKPDILAIIVLFLECLMKGGNGLGDSINYSRASLLKLLHGCEPWRPVMMCSGRDKYHPLQRPRTGDSITCSSGSSPDSPAIYPSAPFHHVPPGESMRRYLKDRLSRTRDLATHSSSSQRTPMKGATKSSWPRTYSTGPVGSPYSRPWVWRGEQIPGGVFLDVQHLWRDELCQRFRDLSCPPGG